MEKIWRCHEKISLPILRRRRLDDRGSLDADRSYGSQEIALTPVQAAEVAKGYRAEALRLKTVVNANRETIGRINDFVFDQDGNVFAVLAVDDQTGLSGHVIAVPFRSLKVDDRSGYIVLPGATREMLQKLPVFVSNR
jgi:sporulation protein YlmC with PRC-barrel domain